MTAGQIRTAFATTAAQAKLSPAADSIRERQSALIERANAHFEKHRDSWTDKKYSELLKSDPPRPELRPPGTVEDRSSRLRRAADHLVLRKQAIRLQRISAAADRMTRGIDNGVGR